MDKSKWEYKKLGEVCTKASSNIVLNKIKDSDGDYPLYGANGFVKNIDFYHQPNEYIGIVKDGSGVGRVNIYPSKSSLVGTMQYILPTGEVTLSYLKYFLQSKNLGRYASGAAIPHIYFKDYSKELIPVLPTKEQNHIVSELDQLSAIISLKQQQVKEYYALIESVFYDMFGESIRENKLQIKTIGELATDVKYGTSKAGGTEGIFKYLRMNNLTNDGYLDLNDIKYIDLSDEEVEKYVVRKGDVLFNRTNSRERVGKTALFDQEEEMVIAGYIIRVRLNNEISPVYLVRYMNLPYMKKVLRKLAKGAVGQANINAQQMKSIEVPLPPLSLQRSFAEKVKAIEHQKSLLKQSIAETQTLLDSRMQEYFG